MSDNSAYAALAARFGRTATTVGRRTCVVILEVEQDDRELPLGILVDAVNDILRRLNEISPGNRP